MPYTMRKVNKKRCYRVSNKSTKRVFAKCTTKSKAKKQLRLLRSLERNERKKEKEERKK